MKRARKRGFLILAVVLVLAIAIGVVIKCRVDAQNSFPMWEKVASEPEGKYAADSGAALSFGGIDFDVKDEIKGSIDVIHVNFRNGFSCGENYRVDYCDNGEDWYAIYEWIGPERLHILGGSGSLDYAVPAGLFKKVGLYRLCIDGLGACEMDLLILP